MGKGDKKRKAEAAALDGEPAFHGNGTIMR